MEEQRLFVYGSLLKSLAHPYSVFLLKHSSYLGVGSFPGQLFNVGEYPGAIFRPGASTRVIGEIYSLHDAQTVLSTLDEYEGVGDSNGPNEFRRVKISVQLNRTQLKSWVYLYNQDTNGLNMIESGSYLDFLGS